MSAVKKKWRLKYLYNVTHKKIPKMDDKHPSHRAYATALTIVLRAKLKWWTTLPE